MAYLDDIIPDGTYRYQRQDLVLSGRSQNLMFEFRRLVKFGYDSFFGQNPTARQTIPPVLDSILSMGPDELVHTLSSGYGQTAIETAATAFEVQILKTGEKKIAWMVPPWAWYVSVGKLAGQDRKKVTSKTNVVAESANEAMARIGLKGIEHSLPYEKYLQAVELVKEKGATAIKHLLSYGIGDFVKKDAMLIRAIFERFDPSTLNIYAIDCNYADAINAEDRLKQELGMQYQESGRGYQDRIHVVPIPHTFSFLKDSNWFEFFNGGRVDPDTTLIFHSGNSGMNLNFNPFDYYTCMENGWLIQELHNVEEEQSILLSRNPLSEIPRYLMQASIDYCSPQTAKVATPLMRFLFPEGGKNPVLSNHLDAMDPEKAFVCYCPNDERRFPHMLAIAPSLELDFFNYPADLGPCSINSKLYGDLLEKSIVLSILTGKSSKNTIGEYMSRVNIRNVSTVDSDPKTLRGIEYPGGAVRLYVADARNSEPTYKSYPFMPLLSSSNV